MALARGESTFELEKKVAAPELKVGYAIRMLPEAAPRTAPVIDPKGILVRLWERNLPLLRERLACLDLAARQAQLGQLTPEARSEAAALAHKLAGSLGMFGYPQGTHIAREIEELLELEGPFDPEIFAGLTIGLRSVLPL